VENLEVKQKVMLALEPLLARNPDAIIGCISLKFSVDDITKNMKADERYASVSSCVEKKMNNEHSLGKE